MYYQIYSYIYYEVLDNQTLVVYNDKYSETHVIDINFKWLFDLLSNQQVTKTQLMRTNQVDTSDQLDHILDEFVKNRLFSEDYDKK